MREELYDVIVLSTLVTNVRSLNFVEEKNCAYLKKIGPKPLVKQFTKKLLYINVIYFNINIDLASAKNILII